MPIPKKPKIRKVCGECTKEIWVRPGRLHKTKYCSNECKYAAKKKQVPKNKKQPIFKKCANKFCNKGRNLKKWEYDRGKYKYCSRACYHYCRSNQYRLDTERISQEQVSQTKRNIWKL